MKKWGWPGHIMRRQYNRSSIKISESVPRERETPSRMAENFYVIKVRNFPEYWMGSAGARQG